MINKQIIILMVVEEILLKLLVELVVDITFTFVAFGLDCLIHSIIQKCFEASINKRIPTH